MSSFPTFSEAASLAVHTVALLAADPQRCLSTKDIATTLNASEAHLSKVLQRLSKSGLVRSVRGPRGGFVLGESAGAATLLDVYECIDGPLPNRSCLLGGPVCLGEDCVLSDLLASVNQQVRDYLAGTRVAQMANIRWRSQPHVNASS